MTLNSHLNPLGRFRELRLTKTPGEDEAVLICAASLRANEQAATISQLGNTGYKGATRRDQSASAYPATTSAAIVTATER